MEALAVFGIACNVIQVISFTRETIAICKEIYNSGTVFDHDGYVDKAVAQYERLCDELQMKIKGEGAGANSDEKVLLEIAQDCLFASTKLKEATSKLVSPSLKGNAFRSLYSGVSAKWREGRLQKLEVAVNKHQARLESNLLMKVCKTTDAVAIQQDAKFAALDDTLRIFIGNIAQGQRSMRSLIVSQKTSINAHTTRAVDAQTGLIKKHITSEVFLARESIVHEINKNQASVHESAFGITRQACSRLLKSLQSEGLQERRSQVVVSHNGTLEWIYDSKKWDKSTPRSGSSDGILPLNGITEKGHAQPDDYDFNHTCGPASTATFACFPCWLAERPGQPYWLCGKAGSGKSTLVKFLLDHTKTRRLLEKTHGPTLILSHFFWLSGSLIQRSLQGVALSLLSQFLNQSQIQEDPMEAVMESDERLWTQKAASVILRAVPGASHNASAQDWSYEELCNAIVALLEASPSAVCIFLDGLDEADPEIQSASPKPVLSLVDRLCRIPRVKVCISSRPEPAFQAKFCKQPQLLLQHLTRDDIMTYVIDNFNSQLPPDHNGQDGGSPMVQDLAGKVCQYSDGVFLWVRLVLRSLLRGLINGDTLTQMHERLELLPRDINKLYQSMWERLEEDDQKMYQREAALYINMTLDGLQLMPHIYFGCVDPLSLCDVQLFAASNPGEVRKVLSNPSNHSFRIVRSQSIQFGKRLETLTAGLLEVAPVTSSSHSTGQVGFIHRSAREFFVNTIEGKHILAVDESTRVWRLGGLFRGILFRKWILWYGRVSSLSTQDPISYKVFEDFISALGQAFGKGFLDREQQLSLIHLCERAYYASAHLTGRCTKAVDWKYSEDISRDLVETFDFNSFIARLGNKDILASCLGADFENWTCIAQVADSDSSERQLPMVYSQNYKAFILYDLLKKHYSGGGSHEIFLQNYECILWMLDQGVFDNWPQGKMAAGLTPGLAGASALALLRSFRCDCEIQYLTILQRCLSLKDAWSENPIFALEESVPRTGVCTIPEHPIVGEVAFPQQENNSYLLLTQATMPFVVLAGLDSIHTEDKEVLRIAQELKDEAWRRCLDGPPPAKIFMLQWHDNEDDFKKGDCGFLNVSDMSWSSLSLSQFCALSRPGPVGPLEEHVLSLNIKECKKWMSIDELEKEIMRRMMA